MRGKCELVYVCACIRKRDGNRKGILKHNQGLGEFLVATWKVCVGLYEKECLFSFIDKTTGVTYFLLEGAVRILWQFYYGNVYKKSKQASSFHIKICNRSKHTLKMNSLNC